MTAPVPSLAFGWALEQAGSLAPKVDAVFWTLTLVSGLLVFLLAGLNLAFLIRYRRGTRADRAPLPPGIESRIETVWIFGTTAAFLGFFFWGARLYLEEERAPADAAEIDVVARQWMWDVRHPDGRRELDQLHVPVGQDVRLLLTSEDVIHSLFIPAFRVKQDVVPGKVTSVWFRATKPGDYELFCAQFCGTQHSGMTARVIALRPEDYARWLAASGPAPAAAERGRRLFLKYNCAGCHDQPAAVRAPPLEGVYGSLVPLQDGRRVRADEQYLRDSILQPAKDVVAGYAPVMPVFQGAMPEGDLRALTAYIESLASAVPAAAAPARTP